MKTCKDEVIAVLEVRNGIISIRRTKEYDTRFVGIDTLLKYKSNYNNPVVMVTESPHVEEFRVSGVTDFTSKESIKSRPVNGVSGQNIMNHMVQLLNESQMSLSDGNYPLLVINALQEQCSQGVDPKHHRTKNFIKLWRIKKHLLAERLNAICPALVICSCTTGDFYLDDNQSAYNSCDGISFHQHFMNMMNNELDLFETKNDKVYSFLDSVDLSGLVLHVIHNVYIGSGIPILKTTHPAAWTYNNPTLKKYNDTEYKYENITICSR
ncbi:hypothetical protein [Salinivibrio kushneri]|uniref:hypothetical protein n=1 Tax=Salinivibrio kushneri TaxID=1908198 RepID=UPI0011AFAF48|nr:hypothetical protein [Salinivibrio kushneri]